MPEPSRARDRHVEAPRLVPSLSDLGELGALDLPDGAVLEDVRVTGGSVPDECDGVELLGCHLTDVGFTGAVLRGARLTDVVLEGCELSGCTWEGASFQRVRFVGCRMSGFTAAALVAAHVAFIDCRLDAAWLRMARLDHCTFEGCDLTGSDLYEAQVRSSSVLRTRLDGSELSGATFDDVALHGSTVEGVSGAMALRGVTIGPDQVIGLALPLLGALGITIEDEAEAADEASDEPAGGPMT
jgi:hypothetical protein